MRAGLGRSGYGGHGVAWHTAAAERDILPHHPEIAVYRVFPELVEGCLMHADNAGEQVCGGTATLIDDTRDGPDGLSTMLSLLVHRPP